MAKTKEHKPEKQHEYDKKPNGKNDTGRNEIYTGEYLNALALSLYKWIESDDNYWLGDFAKLNKIHRRRLNEFAERSKEFSHAFMLAKQHQESILVKRGLNKTFDAGFTKFVLTNEEGWKDKQETDLNVKTFEHFKKEKDNFEK